jgi:lysophospholipase L1-like esterase
MTRTLPPAPSSTILFEGDSLTRFAGKPSLDTWAWMRLTGAHYGYPEKVGDWIFCNRPDLKLTLHTGAIGGSILGDVLERFPTITAAYQPQIVVMTIGSNDVNRGVPLADFRKQAGEFCQKLRDLSDGKVLYLGNVAAGHGATPEAVLRFERAKPYSDAMSEVATSHGGLAVDLGTVLQRKSTVLAQLWSGHTIYHDGIHFNPVGNEIVAGVVLRALGLMTTPGDPDSPA